MSVLRDVTKMERRELAEELVKLRAKHGPMFDRLDELKSALKTGATENFKEVFAGIGEVSVAAPKKGKFKGTMPELVIETYLALPDSKREKLETDGLVAKVDQYGGDYYGAVTVKLF